MGIDINRLAPQAQAQIARKIAEQERQRRIATDAQRPRNDEHKEGNRKYHNTPTERITESGKTIKFDSKREAARYDELILMLQAGKIRDLRLQQNFTLQEGYTLPNGNRVKPIIYKADFVYENRVLRQYQQDGGCSFETVEEWVKVVEDVKGGKATQTRVYAIKKKLMAEKFGIEVQEIE